ncbi:ribosome biogenesis protein BOP1 homolog [Rhopalosiphum maidis]|uniref:ribosome biogenesis protein BOP1 homolog n=1 Tax=Rhopalosiphum maidis TaxID=43146 RepID=UPI000EFFC3CA|nr:ribosome biogenesis protein BOP1 homolog [Rhopalosiphum maidis]XP_026822168.1 ribosome biogenesis protein BOP1 homolog [Rhopalosiphum maidis]XP_026822169.1 ribosome biogenesis protein BOP1 homolog [Rhopalosiphum maidis]
MEDIKSAEDMNGGLPPVEKANDYIEYEAEMDTSDEEDIRNTVGNIPMNWYDEYPHVGYDWDGNKIIKPERGDQLDNFMEKMENPDFWRTVRDLQTGQDVVLSDKDVELIQRIESSKIPDSTYEQYAPWIEWFTSEVMNMPIRNGADHKRSFIASRQEAQRVERYARLIRAGLLKTREQKRREREKKRERSFYMMWSTDDAEDKNMRRITDHIPAPKRNLPSHAESYNPPPEFLFNEREMRIWKKQEETPWKRKLHYVPQKYSSLRQVPAYPKFIKERFTRCMDLYLCPRARKMRLTIEPEDLLPKLPSPKDLQPFPTVQSMVFNGHTDMVRCISIDPLGQYLLSGSDDMTIKIWEISTGRCLRTIPVGGIVRSIEWNPNKALSLVAVVADRKLLIINPGVGDHLIVSKTDSILSTPPVQASIVSDKVKAVVQWDDATSEEWENGIRLVLNHFKEIKQVTWHGRGDYAATVMPDGANRSVLIHQMSTRRSQLPFAKSKGLVQSVLFHPIRPFLFVATQKNIRIYDLVKQELFKKLMSYAKWISSMAIHPGGDNLIVGTYDRKMLWFDLDLSTKPYKTLRLHSTAVRSVAFHKRYPLFASGSDDRALIVSHGMVYNDLLQNPLVVPLKLLKEHEDCSDFGIFGVTFHPTEPWVFSCGADKTIRLFT